VKTISPSSTFRQPEIERLGHGGTRQSAFENALHHRQATFPGHHIKRHDAGKLAVGALVGVIHHEIGS
jgi:hypothetical protein